MFGKMRHPAPAVASMFGKTFTAFTQINPPSLHFIVLFGKKVLNKMSSEERALSQFYVYIYV